MDLKRSTANLIQRLQDAEVTVDTDIRNGGIGRTAANLAPVELELASPCQNVAVVMSANGTLVDLILKEGAIQSMSAHRMAGVVVETVNNAEEIVSRAMKAYIERNVSRKP